MHMTPRRFRGQELRKPRPNIFTVVFELTEFLGGGRLGPAFPTNRRYLADIYECKARCAPSGQTHPLAFIVPVPVAE